MSTTRHVAPVPRIIKRYGSRKLYDPEGSQYVSLQEVTAWILKGEEVRVLDNSTGEDVTVPVLTQVISEQGRRGSSFPTSLLHDLIRAGEEAFHAGEEVVGDRVRRLQEAANQVAGVVQKQVDRLKQPPAIEQQMAALQARLDALEQQFQRIQPPAD